MSKDFSDFIQQTKGKCNDYDHSFGAQCWDLFAFYCVWLGIPVFNCPDTNARSLTYIGNTSFFKPISKPVVGCVGVWTANEVQGVIFDAGHVAMYAGGGNWYGQNQWGGLNCPNGGAQPNYQQITPPHHMYMPYAYTGSTSEDISEPDGEFRIYPDDIPVKIWNGDGTFKFFATHLGKYVRSNMTWRIINGTSDMRISNTGTLTWDYTTPTLTKFKVEVTYKAGTDTHTVTIDCEFTDIRTQESKAPKLGKISKFWMYMKPYKKYI